ncbi:hypothetical protein [Bradyrhizobium sp. USDA 10063]
MCKTIFATSLQSAPSAWAEQPQQIGAVGVTDFGADDRFTSMSVTTESTDVRHCADEDCWVVLRNSIRKDLFTLAEGEAAGQSSRAALFTRMPWCGGRGCPD